MNTIVNKIQYTILFCFLVLFGHAQMVLSLEECRKMALENSRDIQMAEKTIEKATAEQAAMRSYRLPSLSGSATGVYLKDDFKKEMYLPTVVPDLATGSLVPNIMVDPFGQPVVGADGMPVFNSYAWLPLEISLQGAYLAGISVEQPLYTGGKISAGNKMAAIGREMAGYNLELQKMNVLEEVDQAYWLYVSVKEKVKLAEKAVEMLGQLHEKVNHAFETGLVHQNEVLKVQVQQNKAELDLQKARSGLQLTRMSLCRMIGVSFDTPIVAADSLIDFSIPILEQLGGEDVSARPEMKVLRKTVAMEEQNIRMVQSDYLPTLGVSAGYNYIGGIKISETSYDKGNAMLLASLKVPVFNWGQGKNKIASARASKEMKELELEKNQKLLELQMEQARLNLQDAILRIEISEKALEQSNENLRISNDNYELGFETLSELLVARVEWQKTFSELIDAKTDCKIKETTYRKVTGRLGTE